MQQPTTRNRGVWGEEGGRNYPSLGEREGGEGGGRGLKREFWRRRGELSLIGGEGGGGGGGEKVEEGVLEEEGGIIPHWGRGLKREFWRRRGELSLIVVKVCNQSVELLSRLNSTCFSSDPAEGVHRGGGDHLSLW